MSTSPLKTKTKKKVVAVCERELVHMLLAAADALKNQSTYLNDINVFPVADGDTGSNMSATLAALHNDISLFKEYTFAQLADKIMHSIMLHSQGNSGTVLSQFFKGFMAEVAECSGSIDQECFHRAFVRARTEAWNSFQEPVAGTVLDVVDSLTEVKPDKKSLLNSYFENLNKTALAALDTTKKIHPLMKKSHVVDSGAAGLTLIISTWNDLIQSDFSNFTNTLKSTWHDGDLPAHAELSDEYIYCTEIVIKIDEASKSLNTTKLKNELAEFGGYIQAVTYKELLKVHLHTDNPPAVREFMQEFGEEQSYKADDMIKMQKAQQARVSKTSASFFSDHNQPSTDTKIVFVTDSSADFPEGVAPFSIVNLQLHAADNEDLNELDRPTYYERMEFEEGFLPRSSKPPEGLYKSTFQQLLSLNPQTHLIVLTISSAISASHNSASLARNELYADVRERISVVDTRTASAAIGMLLEELQTQLPAQTEVTEDLLNTIVTDTVSRISFYFVVDDMKYLHRNGRISKPLSILGKLLNMSPVLTITDGKIATIGRPLLFANSNKQLNKLKSLVDEEFSTFKIKKVHILYAGLTVEAKANELYLYIISKDIAENDVSITMVNTLIGTHTGPGSFGLFIYRDCPIIPDSE